MSDTEKPAGDHDDHAADNHAEGDVHAPDAHGAHEPVHTEPADDHGHHAPETAEPALTVDHSEVARGHHEPAPEVHHEPVAPAPTEPEARPVWAGREQVEDEPKPARGGGALGETVELVKTVVYALLIAMVLRILFFQPFTIPSASMEPNLYEGDYIVVSKWTYGYSRHSIPFSPPLFEGRIFGRAPERGDIVVFKLPRDNRTDYIKRVIGMPGDQIQMIRGRLHINGQPVDDVEVSRGQIEDMFGPRPALQVRETLPGGASFMTQDFGPGGEVDDTQIYEVPLGHYFMMGDNRDNSIDSRYSVASGVGLVPEENLVGKAQIILFSWEPGASLWNPISWFANVRPSRFFTLLE